MGMFLKTVAAFAIGVAVMVGVQHMWVSSMMAQVQAQAGRWVLPTTQIGSSFKFDPDQLRIAVLPKPFKFDTSAGQRAAIESIARRVDIQTRNALNSVPIIRRPAGMPRY
jgi:hypothetical protein